MATPRSIESIQKELGETKTNVTYWVGALRSCTAQLHEIHKTWEKYERRMRELEWELAKAEKRIREIAPGVSGKKKAPQVDVGALNLKEAMELYAKLEAMMKTKETSDETTSSPEDASTSEDT